MTKRIFGTILVVVFVAAMLSASSCAPRHARTGAGDRAVAAGDSDDFSYDENDRDYDALDRNAAGKKQQWAERDAEANEGVRPVRNASRSRSIDRDEERSFDDEEGSAGGSFFQKGNASWYGREFQGRLTASGERFNMNDMTAAHKTLPFGTVLMVKSLDTGKSVKVRINDRGPYKQGRIIDLSHSAAKKLDMLKTGEAMVGITIVKKGDGRRFSGRGDRDDAIEPVAGDELDEGRDELPREGRGRSRDRGDRFGDSDSGSGGTALQAGAFYSRRNADGLKRKLEGMFDNPVEVVRDGDLYKVRVRGIRSMNDAKRYKRMLEKDSISSFIIQGRD